MGLLNLVHGRGVIADRPAAGHRGREYYATDEQVTYRDNGTTWDAQTAAGYAPGGTDVAVADGGTGASTASGARTNLGLGTMATQDASAVAITGGAIAGITDLPVADGGTGASSASSARTNLGINAANTPFAPNGSIAATDVQAAIQEVRDEAASGAGTLTTVKDEGSNLSTAVQSIDFVGAGVTATGTTAVTVTIPGGAAGSLAYFPGLPSGTLARSYTFASTVESWTASAGTQSATGGKYRLTHTSGAVGIEPVGAANVADGEVAFDFNVVGTVAGSVAVCFRVTDASNFYAFILQPGAAAALFKCVAGAFTQLQASSLGLVSGQFQDQVRILCRFNGSMIEVYVNGSLAILLHDTSFTTGRVGVRADNGTLEIDNVNVYTSPVKTGNVVVP